MHIAPRLARRTPFFYGWAILGAAGSAYFVRNAAASLTLAVFMFPVADELGWSRTLIAGAASVGGLAASGASPIAGWLVDRYGARLVLGVSVLILGLSTISLAWATVPIAFYIAYGTGRVMFSSPLQIGATVVVSRWFVRRRGRVLGLLFTAHSAGMTALPLIAAATIHVYGWRQAWVVLGLLVWGLALAPVWLLIVQRPEDLARIHRRYDVAAAEWVMRGKGRRWSGHDSGKWGRCLSSAAAGRPCDRLGTLGRARWRGEDAARGARGPDWREFAGTFGWADGGSVADGRRQAGSGIARSRARARLNVSQGQRCGRCRVRRRAERVSRPAREKNRRRVLVVAICSPRPPRWPGCGPSPGPSGWRRSGPACGSDRRREVSNGVLDRQSRVSPSRSVMKP